MVSGSNPCSISECKIERQANPGRAIANLAQPLGAFLSDTKLLGALVITGR